MGPRNKQTLANSTTMTDKSLKTEEFSKERQRRLYNIWGDSSMIQKFSDRTLDVDERTRLDMQQRFSQIMATWKTFYESAHWTLWCTTTFKVSNMGVWGQDNWHEYTIFKSKMSSLVRFHDWNRTHLLPFRQALEKAVLNYVDRDHFDYLCMLYSCLNIQWYLWWIINSSTAIRLMRFTIGLLSTIENKSEGYQSLYDSTSTNIKNLEICIPTMMDNYEKAKSNLKNIMNMLKTLPQNTATERAIEIGIGSINSNEMRFAGISLTEIDQNNLLETNFQLDTINSDITKTHKETRLSIKEIILEDKIVWAKGNTLMINRPVSKLIKEVMKFIEKILNKKA